MPAGTFRSATERSEALGAEMAAAQIGIKSVFGHSHLLLPLYKSFCLRYNTRKGLPGVAPPKGRDLQVRG